MKQLLQILALAVGFLGASFAHAAGLTAVSDVTSFLGAIDLADTRTMLLSVGAGLAVLAALYMAIKKGLGMLGWR